MNLPCFGSAKESQRTHKIQDKIPLNINLKKNYHCKDRVKNSHLNFTKTYTLLKKLKYIKPVVLCG
jgi:hypothetical protein